VGHGAGGVGDDGHVRVLDRDFILPGPGSGETKDGIHLELL
jgi:hypothetical protein